MTGERLDELDLAPMVSDNTALHARVHVSIDLNATVSPPAFRRTTGREPFGPP